jgi:hypothetical protein
MTTHIKVEESFVDALIENAAWDAARVPLEEAGKKKKGQSKGDKPKGKAEKDDDKPDFTTGARQGDKSATHPGRDFEDDDDDEKNESVEEHICPLCESHLEEALTDDQIAEHVYQIQSALQSIEEEDELNEQEATVGTGTIKTGEDDADVGPPKSRKAKVQAKVKELKAASKK